MLKRVDACFYAQKFFANLRLKSLVVHSYKRGVRPFEFYCVFLKFSSVLSCRAMLFKLLNYAFSNKNLIYNSKKIAKFFNKLVIVFNNLVYLVAFVVYLFKVFCNVGSNLFCSSSSYVRSSKKNFILFKLFIFFINNIKVEI